jgi:hypothetical protein
MFHKCRKCLNYSVSWKTTYKKLLVVEYQNIQNFHAPAKSFKHLHCYEVTSNIKLKSTHKNPLCSILPAANSSADHHSLSDAITVMMICDHISVILTLKQKK